LYAYLSTEDLDFITSLRYSGAIASFKDVVDECGVAQDKTDDYRLQCRDLEVVIGLGEYYKHRGLDFFLKHPIPPRDTDEYRKWSMTRSHYERDVKEANACKDTMKTVLEAELKKTLCRLKKAFDALSCKLDP